MFLSSRASSGWGCAAACQFDGSLTAHIASDADTLSLRELIRGQSTFVWLGAFQWPAILGQPRENWNWERSNWNYTNWATSQPNDEHGEENCVFAGPSAYWWDEQCVLEFPCVCNSSLNVLPDENATGGVDNATGAADMLVALEAHDRRWARRQHRLYGLAFSWVLIFPSLMTVFYYCRTSGKARDTEQSFSLRQGAEMSVDSLSTSEIEMAKTWERLDVAAKKGKKLRFRIVFICLTVGWLLLTVGIIPLFMATGPWPNTSMGSRGWPISVMHHNFFAILVAPSFCILTLTATPTSRTSVRIVIILLVGLTLIGCAAMAALLVRDVQSCTSFGRLFFTLTAFLLMIICLVILLSNLRASIPPRLALTRLWQQLRFLMLVGGVALFGFVFVLIIGSRGWISHPLLWADAAFGLSCLFSCAVWNSDIRGRVLKFIGGLGQVEIDQQAAAATIASFVGTQSGKQTLQQASARFLKLPVNLIRESDFSSNIAAADLRARTLKAELGACDAFLSQCAASLEP